jgi:hypothetical protein
MKLNKVLISAIKKKWPGECVPCRKAGCEDKAESRSDCLVNLSVQQVLEAVNLFNIKLD